ncbi:Copper amine oxidase N-terminal domain-containing protein [Paenibacillaceae bacterium GAS479]|nr:Copper amine oxidase N-terminal domain-containing protein [Paenibacillaceae bacterium GAS479]
MKNKLFLVSIATIFAVAIFVTRADAAKSILFQDKILTVTKVKTEIYISKGERISPKLIVPGQDISVRAFFGKFTDEVSWNSTEKVAIVKKNGKELVIPMVSNLAISKNQVAMPEGWTYFKNGTAYLKFPYLAYVFDRYAEYESDSEEFQWKEKLSFLDIQYIDTNNSAPKDKMIHSSVVIKELASSNKR